MKFPILEQIAKHQKSSITSFRFTGPKFPMPFHFHPEVELTCIQSGNGYRQVGYAIEHFSDGDLVLLNSGLPHYWKSHRPTDQKMVSLVLQWKPSIIGKDVEFHKINQLLNLANGGLQFVNARFNESIIHWMEEIIDMEPLSKYFTLIKILDTLSESTDFRVIDGYRNPRNRSNKANERLKKIQWFVEQNFQHKIYLSEVAQSINLSEQAFSRFFKQTTGKSFFRFLNEFRINHSIRLLLDTDLTIDIIANQSGFHSLPFFYEKFHATTQQTPHQFRKNP